MSLPQSSRHMMGFVQQVAFRNPYGDLFTEKDSKKGMTPSAPHGESFQELVQKMNFVVPELYRDLGGKGLLKAADYDGADYEMVKIFVLFQLFYSYRSRFDTHIAKQVRNPEDNLPASFGADLMAQLGSHGFCKAECERFVAIFYQIRRAYYFIEQLGGRCRSIKRLKARLWNNIFTREAKLYERSLWNKLEDFSTLILGKTGTGKSRIAATIGRSTYIPFDASRNRFVENFAGTFVATNLSQYPETLIESELFGHRKGAFTGAIENYDGIFARCGHYGVIFLDEIGELSLPIQVKLLNVLQDRRYSPVGSRERVTFHGRIIAATNQPLTQLCQDGQFRVDLFYRLCTDIIELPSLKDRIAETPKELEDLVGNLMAAKISLVDQDLKESVVEGIKRDVGLNYEWPGNIRELEQCVRRILLHGLWWGLVVYRLFQWPRVRRKALPSDRNCRWEDCRILPRFPI